jgi:hypothetical protein
MYEALYNIAVGLIYGPQLTVDIVACDPVTASVIASVVGIISTGAGVAQQLGAFGGKPKMPEIPRGPSYQPPPPPSANVQTPPPPAAPQQEANALMNEADRRMVAAIAEERRRRGRKTLLTGPQGAQLGASNLHRPVLGSI